MIAETLKGDVLHLPRSAVVLGGLALLTWGGAAALVGFQMAGDVPAPCGGFVAIIAGTLTVCAVQLGRREAPAKAYEPAPLRLVNACDETTVAFGLRAMATVPLQRLVQAGSPPTGRTYRSGPRPTPTTVPRPRAVIEAITTGGHQRHGQDYWDAVSDVAETLFEKRSDDPEPDL